MNCDSARAHVEALADGELGAWMRARIRQHVRGCAACAAELDEVLALKRRIAAECPRFSAPASLQARVRALADADVDANARNDRRWHWAFGGALAGAVATAAAILVTGALVDTRSRDDIIVAVVDAHVHATLGGHPADVASSDQHTVKPWLSARLDYSPPVKDLAPEGLALVGGRIDNVRGERVAVLVYRYREHRVDAFVRPHWLASGVEPRTIRGFNVLPLHGQGMDWLVVTDASPQAIAPLAQQIVAPTAVK